MAEPFVRPQQPPDRVLKLSIQQLFDAVGEYVERHRLIPAGEHRTLLTIHKDDGSATFESWSLPLTGEVDRG